MFQAKVREHRYRVIADRIEQSIADGVYEPGERIASIRQLAESFAASINTMKSALNLLQDRGLIESRPRAGTYVVSRPEVFEGSEYVDDLVDAVIEEYTCRPAAAPTTAKMDHAVLPQELVPADLIKSAMQAAASTQSPLLDGFATFERTAELRSLVSQREMLHGIAINPDQLVLASSIEQTVFQLLVTLNPQRLPVAVQAPTYYGHLTILRALGMPAFELPTMPDGSFSVARLAEAVRRNQVGIALLDTAVHNPTGSCLPESVLAEIAHLVDETQLKVIEYGMLRDMRYTTSASPSLYSLAPSGSVFLCSSYAETLVPSIKAAWVAAGTHATHVRDRWQATSCTVSALQLAILEHMLASGKVRRVQDHNRKLVYESLTAAAELVQDTFPAGSQVTAPSGGFALWIRMPEGVSGRDIFRAARKEGIAIAPGAMFARCQDDYDGWIRVAPGILNHDKEQALRRLATLVADGERHLVDS
ncbi:MAG: PLP-dependent aminotransferase family protein [Spirochaetaceae bacterium]|nr:MAG: PLP-dependent aminotransferase family protein [Spirochaetaceae bacterium]